MARNEQTNRRSRDNQPPAYIAWHVGEKKDEKAFWTRIGAAWRHDDGDGLTLQLELIPASGGRIVLRTPKAAGQEGAGA